MTTITDRWNYQWNNTADHTLRRVRRFVDARKPPGSAAVSTSLTGGPSLSYTGLAQGYLNILRLLEIRRDRDNAADSQIEHTPIAWSDLRAGNFPDADIVLVGGEADALRELPTNGTLLAPFRVHLVVATDIGRDAVRARISKRERWEFDRNRKLTNWEFREEDTAEAFHFFYYRMHLPTMQARHQENSRTEPFAIARDAILRYGTLYLLYEHGRPVAGVLCRVDGDTLTTRLLGVLDGADEHYESGAFKAVYHLILEWASTNGVRAVDFYGTEAFISKGIFQWKRKFAPQVTLPPNHYQTKRLYVAPRRDTPEVRDFLVANPLLRCAANGQLVPVYFYDRDRPARTDISAKTRGAPEPELRELDEFLAQSADAGRPGKDR